MYVVFLHFKWNADPFSVSDSLFHYIFVKSVRVFAWQNDTHCKKVTVTVINTDKKMLRLKNTISFGEHFQDKNKSNDTKTHSIWKFDGELSQKLVI